MIEPTSPRHEDQPDPSSLTTAALLREVAHLSQLVDTKIKIIETRLDAIDKATELFTENLVRVPTEVDKRVGQLKELHQEKFAAIEDKFDVRDVTAARAAEANATALQAAFDAQKQATSAQVDASERAIAKAETATTKQIDQIATLIGANTTSQDSKISDLKDRLLLIEGRGAGYTSSWLIAVALVSALLGVGGLVLAVVR